MIISTLEAEAAVLAVDEFTGDDIHKMDTLFEKMKKALEEENFHKYLELNHQSHNLIIEKMDNDILTDIMDGLKKRFFDFPLIMSGIPEWLDLMLSDHAKMIQLFKKKDKEGIRKLIKDHYSYERNISLKR